MVAEQAVLGLKCPCPRAVQQIAKRRLGLNVVDGIKEANLRPGGVASLGTAYGADDPADGGGPLVIAPPEEGEGEKADLV